MTNAVLADAGPLYAAADPADDLHERARRELTALNSGGTVVAVALTTLAEAQRLVLHRLGPRAAVRWLREVTSAVAIVLSTDADLASALQALRRFDDQDITLADALVAVAAERLLLPVWTYDDHFDVMGVDVWRAGEA